MSEFDELDVLVAIRDVGVDQLALDRLDERVAAALSEDPRPATGASALDMSVG